MKIKPLLFRQIYNSLSICLAALLVVSCVGGGGSEANYSNLAQNKSLSNNLELAGKSGLSDHSDNKEKNVIHFYQKDLNARKSSLSQYGQESLPTTIGWDSVNNRPALANCWEFNEQVVNQGTSGEVGNAYSAKAAFDSVNVSGSVSAQFSFFSATVNANYASFSQSSAQSVNAYALGGGTADVKFQITGIPQWALTLYQKDPDTFTQLCGDKVVTALPVKNQVVAELSFYTESSSVNHDINAKLSGHISIVSVTGEINKHSESAVKDAATNIHWITMGAYESNMFNQAQDQLQQCITNLGADDVCTSAFTSFARAATDEFSKDVNLVNQDPSRPLWADYFVVDYTKPNNFTFISTATALAEAGVQDPVTANPAFKPFKDAIQRNVDVLQDLALANSIFKNILGKELNNYLSTIYDHGGYDPDDVSYILKPELLSPLYSSALDVRENGKGVVLNFSTKVNNCLSSTTSADIKANCSLLNPNETVDNVIKENFTSPYPADITAQLAAAITASVHGLIYDVSYSGYNNGTNRFTPFTGYTIWIPGNNQDTHVVLLPNFNVDMQLTLGNSTLTDTPFLVFDEITGNEKYFDNQGTIFNILGQLDPLYYLWLEASGLSSKYIPAYKGQTCVPFSPDSAGCQYIYQIKPSNVIISIEDNYDIDGSSPFKTIYPWAQRYK